MSYSNLMKIHLTIKALQYEHPSRMITFHLYDDWSGAFGYYDHYEGEFIELKAFNTFAELEKIINEQTMQSR